MYPHYDRDEMVGHLDELTATLTWLHRASVATYMWPSKEFEKDES